MEILYDKIICNEKKSNNWKRMHGIPVKATERTVSGAHIFFDSLDSTYVSRRSRKKQRKAHFRSAYNEIVAVVCVEDLELYRIYRRYAYMRRKYKRMLRKASKKYSQNALDKTIQWSMM